MQSIVWISYDLGVNGDYEGLYSWLDRLDAKECGTNVAYLTYIYAGDLMECLEDEITDEVSLDKHSRIYVIRREGEAVKGRYLVGRRKAAPWEGYGGIDDPSEDCV